MIHFQLVFSPMSRTFCFPVNLLFCECVRRRNGGGGSTSGLQPHFPLGASILNGCTQDVPYKSTEWVTDAALGPQHTQSPAHVLASPCFSILGNLGSFKGAVVVYAHQLWCKNTRFLPLYKDFKAEPPAPQTVCCTVLNSCNTKSMILFAVSKVNRGPSLWLLICRAQISQMDFTVSPNFFCLAAWL